jgi:hypothetical protein
MVRGKLRADVTAVVPRRSLGWVPPILPARRTLESLRSGQCNRGLATISPPDQPRDPVHTYRESGPVQTAFGTEHKIRALVVSSTLSSSLSLRKKPIGPIAIYAPA